MFDIGWTEIVVIAVVAILVVGPKDLPRMLRGFGQTLGQLRRSANEFKRQFDDALREAEREADLDDARKQVRSITTMDPLADVKRDVEKDVNPAQQARIDAVKETRAAVAANRIPKPQPAKPADAAADPAPPAKPGPGEAAPPEPGEGRRDSDAA